MTSKSESIKRLCWIKEEDFKKIFEDFFIERKLNKKDLLKQIVSTDTYNNFEIHKVEIKDKLDYPKFISAFLPYLCHYYYDWGKEGDFDEKELELAIKELNQYTPKNGILLQDFRNLDITLPDWTTSKGWDIIRIEWTKVVIMDSDHERLIRSTISTYSLDIESISADEEYLLVSSKNKLIKQTGRAVISYLHGDIWEFILYFLVEWLMGNPVLFSKIQYCKSSSWDKMKGCDGIHLSYDDSTETPYFHFLESKVNSDFSEWLSEALSSQVEFLENKWQWDLRNEINILFKHRRTVDDYYKFIFSDFKDYINPYRREDWHSIHELPFSLVTWITYRSSEYANLLKGGTNPDSLKVFLEGSTIQKIQEILKWYKNIDGLLSWRKVSIFLLPLLDEVGLIKEFLLQIGK